MLAQWISWAARDQFHHARTEPLITLGAAPLHVPEFRAVVLGQLGEARLDTAIDADIAGEMARCKPLDTDTEGARPLGLMLVYMVGALLPALLLAVLPHGLPATKRFLDHPLAATVGGAVGVAYAVTLATGRYDDLVGELYRIATNA